MFELKDLANNFSQLFLVCSYVVTRHILRSIARAFSDTKLLTLTKLFGGIRSIAIGKVLY
jgi:hypothetical protein